MTSPVTPEVAAPPAQRPWTPLLIACALALINVGPFLLMVETRGDSGLAWAALFTVLAIAQLVFGAVAIRRGVRWRRAGGEGKALGLVSLGALASLCAVAGWLGGFLVAAMSSRGGA